MSLEENEEIDEDYDYEEDYDEPQKSSVTAYLGFGLSIVPFFFDILILISLTSLILSIVGLCDCNSHNKKGRGFAIAGIIIAIIDIVLLSIQFLGMIE